MLDKKDFQPAVWLVGNTAASQSEAFQGEWDDVIDNVLYERTS